uniref:Ig-like domain-containing protein n=1 Tax=Anopheles farauti TaxID=69004 RepID=A0A182QW77_9DIPT
MCQINTVTAKTQFGYLHVVVPPNIDDSLSSSDVIVREGSNVTLKCRATGSPTPTVKWKRDDNSKIAINRSLNAPLGSGRKGSSVKLVRIVADPKFLCPEAQSSNGRRLCETRVPVVVVVLVALVNSVKEDFPVLLPFGYWLRTAFYLRLVSLLLLYDTSDEVYVSSRTEPTRYGAKSYGQNEFVPETEQRRPRSNDKD